MMIDWAKPCAVPKLGTVCLGMVMLTSAMGTLAAPAQPQNLVVPPLAFSDTTILVHWDKPARGTPTHYKVYDGDTLVATVTRQRYTQLAYSSPAQPPVASTSGLSNQQLYFELTGLKPDSRHVITVTAGDQDGESRASNAVAQQTTPTPQVVSITDAPFLASTAHTAAHNTPRIQAAINACPQGGKVVFPQGVFRSGALYLKSSCTYEINGTLLGSDLASDYEWGNNRFANYGRDGFGTIAYVTNYKGLLNTCGHYQDWAQRSGFVPDNLCTHPHDIRITGTGSIIGSSGASTDLAKRKYHLTTLAHNQRAAQGGDDERGDAARADLLVLTGVRGLFIGNLKIAYPANHTLFIGRSSNITLFNLNVSSMHGTQPLHNGDGVDLSTAWAAKLDAKAGPMGLLPTNAYIVGNVFDSGDDCINLNAGDALPGVLTATPVNGVHITNNLTLEGHGGVVLGSFTAAGFKNILVQQNTFDGTLIGLRLKTDLGKGGGIAPLSGTDIGLLAIDNQVHAVPDTAISILGSYSGATSFAGASAPGHWKDITIDGMTGTAKGHAIKTSSNPGYENQRIRISRVHITGSAKGVSLLGTQGTPTETRLTDVSTDKGPFVYTQGLLSEANFDKCSPTPTGM